MKHMDNEDNEDIVDNTDNKKMHESKSYNIETAPAPFSLVAWFQLVEATDKFQKIKDLEK
jgi:hypothetical protein